MMTPEERVEKRTLLMGLLLVRDSDMERVHGIIEKCNWAFCLGLMNCSAI
jgi:hypothetical protein